MNPSSTHASTSLLEDARLAALERYAIIDTEAEQLYDDIVQLTADICEVPIALITLLDTERQWFKAQLGLDIDCTRRDISFCRYTIQSDELMIVADAKEDERFIDNPLVIGEPYIRFYAGAPLITKEGYRLGSLCVIDRKPRRLNKTQFASLPRLARQVMAHIETRATVRRLHTVKSQLRQEHKNLDETKRALQVRNQQIYKILNSIRDGFFTVDEEWNFQYVNREAERILQRPRKELIGRNLLELFPETRGSEFHKYYRQAIETLKPVNFTAYSQVLKCWFDVAAYPLLDGGLSIYFQDVSDRQRMEQALREAKITLEEEVAVRTAELRETVNHLENANAGRRRLLDILEATPDLVGMVGCEDGRLYYINQAGLDFFGLAKIEKDLLLSSMLPTRHLVRLWDEIIPYAREHGRWQGKIVLNNHQKEEMVVSLVIMVHEGHGDQLYASAILHDITPLRNLENKLRNALHKERLLNELKSKFVTMISHEFRTPLSIISTYTALIQHRFELGGDDRHIRSIHSGIERLRTIFNRGLEFLESEETVIIDQPIPTQIASFIHQIVGQVQVLHPDRTILCNLDFPHRKIQISHQAMRILLLELLTNALRYSQKEIVLSMRLQGNQLELKIKDSGSGIPAADLDYVTDPFYRADNASFLPGAGLGLAIVRQLIEQQNGRWQIDSQLDKGTEIIVMLPLTDSAS